MSQAPKQQHTAASLIVAVMLIIWMVVTALSLMQIASRVGQCFR